MNESGQSLRDSSYGSGVNSPDPFEDDDEDGAYEELLSSTCGRLERTLQGVPPPPSVTIPQLNVVEMLAAYKAFLPAFEEATSAGGGSGVNDSRLWIGGEDHSAAALRCEWSSSGASRAVRHYDVYYNLHAEHLDALVSRYRSRYVGCETASSCVAAVSACRSPLKRTLRSGKPSPGKRLSHLARRRIAMCNAANFREIAGGARRTVLVDRKKYSNAGVPLHIRKSPRFKNTPKKNTPSKKTPSRRSLKKATPKSSQKKQRGEQSTTPSTSRRALFVSPESDKSEPRAFEPAVTRSKRALFISPIKEEDESREDYVAKRLKLETPLGRDNVQIRNVLHKSLSFSGDKVTEDRRLFTRYASENLTQRPGELSEIHKKKLLWAVAEALRPHGVGVKHEHFKTHMTALARLTRKLCQLSDWARLFGVPGTSTSETFLRIARKHSFAIVRGKSVDDLFDEERTKSVRPDGTRRRGYVSIEAISTKNEDCENSHSLMSRAALRDKFAGADGVFKNSAVLKNDNGTRARRKIDFEPL